MKLSSETHWNTFRKRHTEKQELTNGQRLKTTTETSRLSCLESNSTHSSAQKANNGCIYPHLFSLCLIQYILTVFFVLFRYEKSYLITTVPFLHASHDQQPLLLLFNKQLERLSPAFGRIAFPMQWLDAACAQRWENVKRKHWGNCRSLRSSVCKPSDSVSARKRRNNHACDQ